MLKIFLSLIVAVFMGLLFKEQTFSSISLGIMLFAGVSILHFDPVFAEISSIIKVFFGEVFDEMKRVWNHEKFEKSRTFLFNTFAKMPLLTVALPLALTGLLIQEFASGNLELIGLIIWMIGMTGISFNPEEST